MVQLNTGVGTVVGYTFNADVYCVGCTERYIEESDNPDELEAAANGENDLTGEHVPHPVMYDSEWDGQPHCGSGKGCVNATTDHEYHHTLPVGQPIQCNALDYWIDGPDRHPEIIHEDDEEFMFRLDGSGFGYTFDYEKHDDILTFIERLNMGTGETESYRDAPETIQEAAEDLIQEGKEAGAF